MSFMQEGAARAVNAEGGGRKVSAFPIISTHVKYFRFDPAGPADNSWIINSP